MENNKTGLLHIKAKGNLISRGNCSAGTPSDKLKQAVDGYYRVLNENNNGKNNSNMGKINQQQTR